MSDERPRPAYGEYATPEEQRARIAQPSASWELAAGHTLGETPPAVAPTAPVAAPAPAAPAAQVAAPAPAAPAAQPLPAMAAKPRMADRIATIALLTYGLINVVSSAITLTDYSTYANSILAIMGVDATFTDAAAARPWTIAATAVLIVGWVLTAAISVRSLRRGRLTWWIPLVAGVVFNIVAGTLVMMPLMSDPAIWNAIMGATSP